MMYIAAAMLVVLFAVLSDATARYSLYRSLPRKEREVTVVGGAAMILFEWAFDEP